MKNEDLNILDEINKGATMGMDAIAFVSDKVDDQQFKGVISGEYNKYKEISERVNDLYSDYSDKKPHLCSRHECILRVTEAQLPHPR